MKIFFYIHTLKPGGAEKQCSMIAAALKNVYDRRDTIKRGVKIVWETELMRHFTVKLERIEE